MRVRQQYGQNAHSRREEAWMSVLTSGHLGYHSGPAAGELLREWKRVVVDFDIDDETRKPRAVHLSRARLQGEAARRPATTLAPNTYLGSRAGSAERATSRRGDRLQERDSGQHPVRILSLNSVIKLLKTKSPGRARSGRGFLSVLAVFMFQINRHPPSTAYW